MPIRRSQSVSSIFTARWAAAGKSWTPTARLRTCTESRSPAACLVEPCPARPPSRHALADKLPANFCVSCLPPDCEDPSAQSAFRCCGKIPAGPKISAPRARITWPPTITKLAARLRGLKRRRRTKHRRVATKSRRTKSARTALRRSLRQLQSRRGPNAAASVSS
jgi:hypothetical protein